MLIALDPLHPDLVDEDTPPGPRDARVGGATGGSGAREEEPRGWEDIAEWTGGIGVDQVDALREVRVLEPAYPLLHALVGRSLRDFLVRAAAMECLVSSDLAQFGKADLDQALWWLDEQARESTLRGLRQSGWLHHDPAGGTTITDAGRWACDILSFLHRRLRESELLPTLAGVEYALRIGVDPLHHLLSMRSRLVALRHQIDDARASHSEVVLRRAVARLEEALRLSEQIRTATDRVSLDHVAARAVVREIHDLLSSLHLSGADLHAAITEVGRQYLHLAHGLTVEQIVSALMRKTRAELVAAGRDALLPAFRPPPLLTTEVVASAAEQHFRRERHDPEPVVWEEPPQAPRATDAAEVPGEVLALIADLDEIARSGAAVALAEAVPRRSAGESFLRASLLSLAGERGRGEGIAGRLGAIPVDVMVAGEPWPEPLEGSVLRALTPGHVQPRKDGEDG